MLVGLVGDRDDGRCVRTSLQWFQLSIMSLAYC